MSCHSGKLSVVERLGFEGEPHLAHIAVEDVFIRGAECFYLCLAIVKIHIIYIGSVVVINVVVGGDNMHLVFAEIPVHGIIGLSRGYGCRQHIYQ